MGPQDLKQIVVGFIIAAILVSLAVMFPVYQVKGIGHSPSKYVRRPIWDPPTIPVGHQYENIPPAELERRMSEDPRFRSMVERWRKLPKEIAVRPIFIPARGTHERNWLGVVALYSTVGYIGFVIFKFVNRG